MQKRWKMLMALMLALMLLLTSVYAEETEGAGEAPPSQEKTQESTNTSGSESTGGTSDTSTPDNAGDSDSQGTPVTTAPAETATEAPTAVPTETATATPTAAPTETTVTSTPEVTTVPGATATPTAAPSESVTDAPNAPATQAPPTATPTVRPSSSTTDKSKQENKADQAATVNEQQYIAAKRRATWVAVNVSLKNYKTDKKAMASMWMTQMLLARAVADGDPVGVYTMNDDDPLYMGVVDSAEEWNELVAILEASSYSGASTEKKKDDNVVQFRELLYKLRTNEATIGEAEIHVLEAVPQTKSNDGTSNMANVSEIQKFTLKFYSFQRENEELQSSDHKWLMEFAKANMTNLSGEVFYYETFVDTKNSADACVKQAMEIFGLNMRVPYTDPDGMRTENNGVLWNHEGMDTLLVVDTVSGGVTVSAESAEGEGTAFPVVMKLSDTRYMVLLRNVAAGKYLIAGNVHAVIAAYNITDAELMMQNAPEENVPLALNLEDHQFSLHLNVTQVNDEDVGLRIRINGAEYDCRSDGWKVLTEKVAEGVEIKVDVSADKMPLDEGSKTGEGTLQFVATVGSFKVESPEYAYVVTDRPLQLSGEALIETTYYCNVPGQENQTFRLELSQYFINEDNQTLNYTPADAVENGVFTYTLADDNRINEWRLYVDDGVSEPLELTIRMSYEDVLAAVQRWKAAQDSPEMKGELGKATSVTFTLPAEAAALYAKVREQYPELPETLEEALQVSAVLTDSHDSAGKALAVTLTAQEDGSIVGSTEVEAYDRTEKEACVTFAVNLLGEAIEDQQIIQKVHIEVVNDSPKLAEDVEQTLTANASVQGAPGKRTPLSVAEIKVSDGKTVLPQDFIPEQLFVDRENLAGLTITIQAEPADLVQLVKVSTSEDGERVTTPVEKDDEGKWVLEPEESKQPHELQLLDKGTVTLRISASDGECNGEQEISWTFRVNSPYDTTVLIIIIAAALLAIAVIVLLILREIRKPSFARMNSTMYMRMCTNYSPSGTFVAAPMSVYGKKETDLAHLFIACQQTPVVSMPMDVLADVAIQPGKRRSYRLVLGKRAEKLNVVVGDQAQNPQKPVIFGHDQQVRIYADMDEVLFLQITTED